MSDATEAWRLTDDERDRIRAAIASGYYDHTADVKVSAAVESIKAAAYRAGQVAALKDAAEEVAEADFNGFFDIGSMGVEQVRDWLRDRATELGDTPNG